MALGPIALAPMADDAGAVLAAIDQAGAKLRTCMRVRFRSAGPLAHG